LATNRTKAGVKNPNLLEGGYLSFFEANLALIAQHDLILLRVHDAQKASFPVAPLNRPSRR
jgi:hypothetical protein